MPDGTEGSLSATQFAERAAELESQGATFDFAEFSKVVDGKKGPVFKAIENIVAKRGGVHDKLMPMHFLYVSHYVNQTPL